MKISDQAKALAQALSDYATPKGGVAAVVSNVQDLWLTAAKSSQAPRILICYEGEKIRGDFPVAAAIHRVDKAWQVAVTRGRGFKQDRGSSLTDTNQDAPAFYDEVEAIRDLIRSLTGISVELPLDYIGIRPMEMGNLIMDGFIIEFSTADDLPGIQAQPDSLQPSPLPQP